MKQIWHECYINGSKTNFQGVAVLVNNNFEFKVSKVIKDDDAIFLQLLVSCNELNINLINIYAMINQNFSQNFLKLLTTMVLIMLCYVVILILFLIQ